MDQSEHELIERCIAGDERSWRSFLDCYGSVIYGAVAGLLGKFSIHEPAVAEDIFAAIIEKLLADRCAALRGFKSDSKFTTYLVSIARNRTYDHLRYLRRRPTVSMTDPIGEGTEGGEDQLEKRLAADLDLGHDLEVKLTLDETLRKLPTSERLILQLYFIEGMKDREIGELLKLSVDAVSARKSRALKKLKDLVGKGGL
jgi:RNA polymerase sigma factor (sigma-70 family)